MAPKDDAREQFSEEGPSPSGEHSTQTPLAERPLQQRQLERLEQKAVEGWLTASEKLDEEVERDRHAGSSRDEMRDLRHEVEALKNFNRALDRVLQYPTAVETGEDYDPALLDWVREHVEEIQIRVGALADEISHNTALTEETREELLAQYDELREELDDLQDDPDKAASALGMLRRFVLKVARYMEKVVKDWLPLARVLLPLLGPGSEHLMGGHDHGE